MCICFSGVSVGARGGCYIGGFSGGNGLLLYRGLSGHKELWLSRGFILRFKWGIVVVAV